jgi:hypothetical protein
MSSRTQQDAAGAVRRALRLLMAASNDWRAAGPSDGREPLHWTIAVRAARAHLEYALERMEPRCPHCGGTGFDGDEPCEFCAGAGRAGGPQAHIAGACPPPADALQEPAAPRSPHAASTAKLATVALLGLLAGCATLENGADHARDFARAHPVIVTAAAVGIGAAIGAEVASDGHHVRIIQARHGHRRPRP